MIFFFDRNIALRLARMLDAFDPSHTIRHQDDDARFAPTTPDVVLVRALAHDRPRPTFVTADVRMRGKPEERKALAGSRLTIVFLRKGWHSVDMHTQAWKLLRLWPEIVRETLRVREPSAFEITPAARKVQWIGPTAGLAE